MVPRQGLMRKGKSVGCSQSATSSGQKTLRRCKTNKEADGFVVIDLDSDDDHNVILVDVPAALRKKLQGSSILRKDNKRSRLGTVINIDDGDEDDDCVDDKSCDDDEDSDNNPPGTGAASGDHLNNGASTSGRFSPASTRTHNSLDDDGDECEIIQDNLSPFKFSKCKRTYSQRTSSRNRYGLGPESDIDLSGDDVPDTDLMEDSCGKVREQWEKANMKRKSDGQSGNCNEATASRLHPTWKKADLEDFFGKHRKDHPSPSSSNARFNLNKPSPLEKDVDEMFRTYSSEDPFADLGVHSPPHRHYFDSKTINSDREESYPVGPSSNTHEGTTNGHNAYHNSSFFAEEDYQSPGASLFSRLRRDNQQVNNAKEFPQPNEKDLPAGTFTSDLDPASGKQTGNTKNNLPDESIFPSKTQRPFETEVNHGSEAFQKDSCVDPCSPMDEDYDARSEVGAVPMDSQREGTTVNSGIEKEKGCRQVSDETTGKESSFCSDPRSEEHTEPNIGATDLSKEKDDQVNSEDVDDGHDIPLNIINDKEKLKETDEYKRAAEEEWASRQRELQTQAEEAQRLKRIVKRKKAESMRLLDMERRQKQRVEEVREIQKKDAENMNMKEQLRSEVRKELNMLEVTCRDMATLLRGLGVQVGSGIQPLPHEVRAAYKRALLIFHPDRASGSDIRQLVEAEEKFKLISRMKEKLLVT